MQPAADLRPLGLGALLDRAVTLFVRRFGVLAGAVAVVYIPFSVVQWLLIPWAADNKTTLTREEWTSWAVDIALGSIVFAVARTATAAIAHAAYMGRPLSLGAAYRLAAQRLGAQMVAQIGAAVIACAILIVLAIPLLVTVAIATSGGAKGTVPIVVAITIAGAIGLVLGAWLFLGVELATVRIATSANGAYVALFTALRATVFRRPWHALLTSLALLLVLFGGSLVFSGLAQLMPTPGLRTFMMFGVGSVVEVAIEAFSIAFLVAYAVDLAVRHEGLDLAVALDGSPHERPAVGP